MKRRDFQKPDKSNMRGKRRPVKLLAAGIFFLILQIILIIYLPPDIQFSIYNKPIYVLYIFFPVLFLFLFSLGSYLFNNKIHGLLLALFVISYLLFRLNNLTHPFFLLLLLALFVVLEFLFSYRK